MSTQKSRLSYISTFPSSAGWSQEKMPYMGRTASHFKSLLKKTENKIIEH
jgi:hypothetical protein